MIRCSELALALFLAAPAGAGPLVSDAFGLFAPFQLQAVVTLFIVVASWRLIEDDVIETAAEEKP